MTGMQLEFASSPMQQYRTYIQLLRRLDRRLLAYQAPCCGVPLEGPAALEGEEWRTGATCPQCSAKYYKQTTQDSIIATLRAPARGTQ